MKLVRLIPHISFILACIFLLFWILDRVNGAMEFLDNDISNGMLLALCAAAAATSLMRIYDQSKKD